MEETPRHTLCLGVSVGNVCNQIAKLGFAVRLQDVVFLSKFPLVVTFMFNSRVDILLHKWMQGLVLRF